jgi:hypothetical protein
VTADDISPDRSKFTLYVVVDNGVNSRIRSLGKLRDVNTDVVFVTSKAVDVSPFKNLVVRKYPNPFGVLRAVGLHRLKQTIDSIAYFPTRHLLYVLPVLNRLNQLIADDLARGARVVVLTCAPPHALCLVGQKLKVTFPQIWWVIDWQDLWSSDETYLNVVFPLYRACAKRLEHDLVLQADMNVTTNQFAKRAIEELHHVAPHRVAAVNHHFDAIPSSPAIAPNTPVSSQTLRIVFMGGMFKPPKVLGGKFLETLKQVRARGVYLELHLYGSQGDDFERYRNAESEYGFVYHGKIPHDQVLVELRQYDYQLLLLEDLPNSRLIMHLKVPEYLNAGVPIIAIVPKDSAVQEIVERTGTGHVIPADSDWVQELSALFEAGARPLPVRNDAEIARFDWSNVEGDWRRALALPESSSNDCCRSELA